MYFNNKNILKHVSRVNSEIFNNQKRTIHSMNVYFQFNISIGSNVIDTFICAVDHELPL